MLGLKGGLVGSTFGGSQQPQQPFNPYSNAEPVKRKKGGGCLKWGLIILGLLVLLGIFGGMLGSGDGDGSDSDKGSDDSQAKVADNDNGAPEDGGNAESDGAKDSSDSKDSKDAELAVGETANLKGFEVTLSSLYDNGPNVFGDNDVCADLSISNGSKKEVHVNPWDFNLTTPAGITVDPSFTGEQNFQDATVNPGGNMNGTLCFEAEATPGDYKVGYEPVFAMRNSHWTGQL